MEVCPSDSAGADNDGHIITLMGNPNLNLVDTSMLPSDPRAMMDFVGEVQEQEENSLAFPSPFQTNNYNINNGAEQDYSTSSLRCSVALSTAISPMNRSSPSSGLISHASHPSSSYERVDHIHSQLQPTPSDRDKLASMNHHSSIANMLDVQEYQQPYYSTAMHNKSHQSSNNSSAFSPDNGYEYSSNLSAQHPPTISPHRGAMSPAYTPPSVGESYSTQTVTIASASPSTVPVKMKRSVRSNPYNIPLKKEPSEEDYNKHHIQQMHGDILVGNHVPCSSFTTPNMNIQDHQRHSSGGESHQSPIVPQSPLSLNSTPKHPELTRLAPSYIYSSDQASSSQLGTDTNVRHLAPIQMQQHHHQTQLYQSIPLQHLHQESLVPSFDMHPGSRNEGAYSQSFQGSNGTSGAAKCLSFNYGVMTSQNSHAPLHQQNQAIRRDASEIVNETSQTTIDKSSPDTYISASDEEDGPPIEKPIKNTKSSQGFECAECQQVCRTRGALRKHLATEHQSNEPEPTETIRKKYTCPLAGNCLYTTTLRSEFDEHVAKHMKDGYTPMGKKRNNKQPLQRHRYSKEELQCPLCTYICTVEKAFKGHLLAHRNGTKLYKFSCPICGKDKDTEASINQHIKRHKSGRHYNCDICDFSSVQLKKLIQHRRMHTGEKHHLCPHCTYRAARRDNLRSHVRRMHKKLNMYGDTFTPKSAVNAELTLEAMEASEGAFAMHAIHHVDLPNSHMDSIELHHQMLPQHNPQQQQQQHILLDRLQQSHHIGTSQESEMARGSQHLGLHSQNVGMGGLPSHNLAGMIITDEQLHSQGILLVSPHSNNQMLPGSHLSPR